MKDSKGCLCVPITLVLFILCFAAHAPAEQPPYQVTRALWALMDGNNQTRTMEITAGLEIEGLWGPVPAEDGAHKYLSDTFDPAKETYSQKDTGPCIRVSGYQSRGRQVRVKVHCPTPEELGTLRNSDTDTYSFFRPTRRLIYFRFIRSDDFNNNDFEKQIQLEKDETAGTITWTPAEKEYSGRSMTAAPVVMEIAVWYQGFSGLVVDGNPSAGWEKKTHKELRIGWLVMPICGNTFGDFAVRCPAEMGPSARWRSRTLGDLSLAVPDNWLEDRSPEKDQGRWRMDYSTPPAAELLLARVDNPNEWLQQMELKKDAEVAINGIEVRRYEGRIPQRNADAVLCIPARKDGKGRTILLAAVAADRDRDGFLLEAAINSLTMGPEAPPPSVSADPAGPSGKPLVIASIPGAPRSHGQAPPPIAPAPSGDQSASQDAPAPAVKGKLSLGEQEALAQKLFQQMADTPMEELDTFDRLYKEVMEKCPDTERAEISYWRLSNLYLLGYEPPRLDDIVTLLETFLERYPDSDGVPPAKERLLSTYERTERWCKAADLYGQVMPRVPEDPDPEQAAVYLSYGEALEKCGRPQEALGWYQAVVDASGGEDTLWVRAAREALARVGDTFKGDQPQQPVSATELPSAEDTISVRLVREKGFADFVGRNEMLQPDGSADSRFILEINEPGKVVNSLAIVSTSGQDSRWDTIPGNGAWLVAATLKNAPLNNRDGSLNIRLPSGPQKYELWVQDNNSIAGRKTTYRAVVTFQDGITREVSIEEQS